jgi:hypothetical protein
VVMVPKRDDHRLCVNFKELNSLTQPDAFPIPPIEDILTSLHGAQHRCSPP